MLDDVIVALATPPLEAALAVIRISGKDSFVLLKRIFDRDINIKKHQAYFGCIVDGENIIDEVIVTTFVEPNSFTGENSFEISCHGGLFIINKIISVCIKNGARIADKGEFSKRSYLNGKMDLIQAEAINDMIKANSDEESKLAIMSLRKETSKMIESVKEDLLQIITSIEVNIDYPEYDDTEIITKDIALTRLKCINNKIEEILKDAKIGRIIKDGINVAIVGKPNVGKSSLLNALLNEEKAIVTNVAGTTRDVVEGQIIIDGLKLNLLDTAGIRKSKNKVEKIGIERTLKTIEKSDLVLLVLDGTEETSEEDIKLIEMTKNKKVINIINKADLIIRNQYKGIKLSAKNKEIGCLKEEIKKQIGFSLKYENKPLLTNIRQIGLIESSQINIKKALLEIQKNEPIDLVLIDIKKALMDIEDIMGDKFKFNLLDEIFSRFCLGK